MRAHHLFPLLFIALLTEKLKAQIFTYTDSPAGVYNAVAVNATGTYITRVNGATAASDCPSGFISKNLSAATAFNFNRTANEFTVTPISGSQLNITSLTIECRRNNKGPKKIRAAYSTNGGTTWTTSPIFTLSSPAVCSNMAYYSWDMADFSTTSAVLIRVYAFDASTGGTVQLKNIILNGNVTFTDSDGDGFASNVDCNDADPAINPSAAEICNALDDNCDGNADESVTFTTWYADNDGDGYGNSSDWIVTCDGPPVGYVSDNTDCDDSDPSLNPAATEICNALDDNCDGNADEGIIFSNWYADNDGDGYGNASELLITCDAPPAGYVSDNTDCNDTDPFVNPSAVEVINAIDDNCDGSLDLSAVEFAGPPAPRDTTEDRLAVRIQKLVIFPNPAHGKFTIYVQTNKYVNETVRITIFNITGQIVYARTAEISQGFLSEQIITGKSIQQGIYMLKLNAPAMEWTGQIIVAD